MIVALGCASWGASPARAGWVTSIEASNPLNWFPFEETSGGTFADHGREPLVGVADPGAESPVVNVPGLVGKAVEFNGLNDRIVLNGNPVSGDWTAEFIVKRTTSSPTSAKLLRGAPFELPGSSLDLEQFNGTKQVGYTEFGAKNHVFEPGYSTPADAFVHLVYQRIGDQMKLYVDGQLEGTGKKTVDMPRFQLGDNTNESILAVLDEMVLYDRALSKAEINTHFRATSEPDTLLGDTNGDQTVGLGDFAVLKANFGRTWTSFGDANLDGIVDDKDIAALKVDYGKPVGGDNDLNGDGRVDIGDFVTLKQGMGTRLGVAIGDLNGDGAVNISDFGLLKQQFGVNGAAAVPEPAALLTALQAALLAGLMAMRRRWPRR